MNKKQPVKNPRKDDVGIVTILRRGDERHQAGFTAPGWKVVVLHADEQSLQLSVGDAAAHGECDVRCAHLLKEMHSNGVGCWLLKDDRRRDRNA